MHSLELAGCGGPRQATGLNGAGPRTPTEALLCDLFSVVLQVGSVGPFDDFFALGGDSLLATRLMTDLSRRLNKKLPLSGVYEASTVAELAEWSDEYSPGEAETVQRSERLPYTGANPPIQGYAAGLAPTQRGIWFLEQLAPNTMVNVVLLRCDLPRHIDRGLLARSIEILVSRHVALSSTFDVAAEEPGQETRAREPRLRVIDLSANGRRGSGCGNCSGCGLGALPSA